MNAADDGTGLPATTTTGENTVRVTVEVPGERAMVIAASRCGSAITLSVGEETARLSPARAATMFSRMATLAQESSENCTAAQLRGARPAGTPAYPEQLRGLVRLRDPQRWVPCEDRVRHAIPSDIVFAPGDAVPTFCGLTSTVDEPDTRHLGTHKTCADCTDVICDLLGYPPPGTPLAVEPSP